MKTKGKESFVLVHAAWLGGWSWEPVAQGHIQQTLELAGIQKVIPVIFSDPHHDFPFN